MKQWNRRELLKNGALLGIGMGLGPGAAMKATPRARKDGVSLAEWALNQEIRAGEFTNLDFPRLAREEFGIDAVEFVNTLFEVPTLGYLRRLKHQLDQHGVRALVMMVDDEGDPVHPDPAERELFVASHRKWVDVACYLECHSVRTNCRGNDRVSPEQALKLAQETYGRLLEYAVPAKMSIVIENHGGLSDDAEWMVELIESVNNLYFGSYIDWRWRDPAEFDNLAYLKRLIPYATGCSYKKQPNFEHFQKMVEASRQAGYKGYYAIEDRGREGIRLAQEWFAQVLQLT